MSLRKRKVDLVDSFDSRNKGTFNQKPRLEQVPHISPTLASVPQLTMYQSLEVLSVLLKDYQSKFVQLDDSDPFYLWFPYAWTTIKIGDKIKNLNTKEVYHVDEVILDRTPAINNYVRVKGTASPRSFHMLRLDSKKSRLVDIVPAYPDTEVKPYSFTAEGHIQDTEDSTSWVDSITYTVTKEAPGSRDRKPFGDSVEYTPQYRETVDNVVIHSQLIESMVRLDFWTRSNGSSEKMREWFRDFTHKYKWLMEHNGVLRFMWMGSFTADKATRWRPGIVHRSSEYYFRTEYSISQDHSIIRDIDVSVTAPLKDESGDILNTNINITD